MSVSICPNCGSRNTGDVANCLRCQTPLPAPQETSAPAPAPDAAQTPATSAPPPPQQPAAPPPPQYAPALAPTQSSGSGARIAVIVAVVFVVLVVGIGAYIVSNRSEIGPPPDVGGTLVIETPVTPATTTESAETETTCLGNIKQLGLAGVMYADDHDGKLPSAAWAAELAPYLKNASILRCPSRPDLQVAYAMNEELVGGSLLDIASPTETIMFFETAVAAPSPVGGPELVPAGGIHNGGLHVVSADGYGKWVPVDQVKPTIASGTSVTETPTTTETPVETPGIGASSGGLDLDSYVGNWEFVGEPGPWGEGAPFSLERAGNILVGTAGLPYLDQTTRLELTAGNDGLRGESITTHPDGETEAIALRMAHDRDLLEVRFQRSGGEWRHRAARRTAAAGD